jgi:hypothetical protein
LAPLWLFISLLHIGWHARSAYIGRAYLDAYNDVPSLSKRLKCDQRQALENAKHVLALFRHSVDIYLQHSLFDGSNLTWIKCRSHKIPKLKPAFI